MNEPIYHNNLVQGSDEWLKARLGIITASQMKNLITPKGKVADNKDSRAIVFEKVSERLTNRVEDGFSNDHIERGNTFEPFAIDYYEKHIAPVESMGFITREFDTKEFDGITIGYSPDGLVGDDGLIEVKCPARTKHVREICLNSPPSEYMMQMQAGMLITGRKWCDYIAYYNGMKPRIVRVLPDEDIFELIYDAVINLEECILSNIELYKQNTANMASVDFIEGELYE